MRRHLGLAAALLAFAALVPSACSVGAGDADPGGATLDVTRDFGNRVLVHERTDEVPGGETVMRFLQRAMAGASSMRSTGCARAAGRASSATGSTS
jgi:hypothetical protein